MLRNYGNLRVSNETLELGIGFYYSSLTTVWTTAYEDVLNSSYRMAAQIALATAIVVALGILIALVWNTLKRRWHGADGHTASPSARRSLDSVERLIQDRMRNRPPPYETAEADKPPTYENSFSDPCTPPQFDVPVPLSYLSLNRQVGYCLKIFSHFYHYELSICIFSFRSNWNQYLKRELDLRENFKQLNTTSWVLWLWEE